MNLRLAPALLFLIASLCAGPARGHETGEEGEQPEAPGQQTGQALSPEALAQQRQALSQDRSLNLVTPVVGRVFDGLNGKPVTQANVDQFHRYLESEQKLREYLNKLPNDGDIGDRVRAILDKGDTSNVQQDRMALYRDIMKIMRDKGMDWKAFRDGVKPLKQDLKNHFSAMKDNPISDVLAQHDMLAAMTKLGPPDKAPGPGEGGKEGGGFFPPPVNMAKAAIQQGDAASAMDSLNDAISDNPKNGEALSLRAGLNYANGNISGAANDARAALDALPGDQRAQKILSMTQGRGGYGSMSAADSAGALGADQSGANGAGRPSGGGSSGWLANMAISANSGPSGAAVREGQAALRVGDYASGIQSLSKALELNPGNAQAYNLRAIAYNRTHQFSLALKDAIEGLKADPKNVALLLSKATALNKLHRYAEAEAAARQALELDPNNAAAYNALAEALAGQRKNSAAVAALQQAARLDPAYAAKAKEAVQLPSDSDLSFLFPDDETAQAAGSGKSKADAAGEKARQFKLIVLASLAGGSALGLFLIWLFMPRIKDAITRLTRSGPRVSTISEEEAPPLPGPALTKQAPGLLRGQYQLGAQIGEGGMGVVFEGLDTSLRRKVAIKKMRQELRVDARERSRFIAEAKVVAALHHPSIVDIYAIAEQGEDLYLVFEYVDGKTLHELVYGAGRLTLGRAMPLIKAAAQAIDFAHSKSVIHRDLKPSNIMVGHDGRAKVMDFGIARLAKDALSKVSMTNTVVGTPPYMAPEQERGVVRRESDVYALAICLYEMLAGRLPFNGAGSGMLMNKINRVYAPLSGQAAGLPPGIDDVFARAFDPDPEKRFHSAGEFVAGLEALALPQRG